MYILLSKLVKLFTMCTYDYVHSCQMGKNTLHKNHGTVLTVMYNKTWTASGGPGGFLTLAFCQCNNKYRVNKLKL